MSRRYSVGIIDLLIMKTKINISDVIVGSKMDTN